MFSEMIEWLKLLRHMTWRHIGLLLSLKRGDVAIDCGANIGVISRVMALRGATVHAFEPNPYAFDVLKRRSSNNPSIHLYQKAAGVRDETVKLYLHQEADKDQVGYSEGSSLLSTKTNVNPDTYCEVPSVDLAAFILSLDTPISILKMDIEGYEVEVIPHLIRTGAIHRIHRCLVELHEHKAPELLEKTKAMRELIVSQGLSSKFVLDWH